MEPLSRQMSVIAKSVYTPYDLSLLSRKEPAEVYRWFDEGKLEFFHTAGGHCRIRHDDLVAFFDREGLSLERLDASAKEKYRVLVVEDDKDLLEILAELLSDDPRLEIKMEQDGFSAGLVVESWHPELILLDFLMPGMSGFEVCKKIRTNERTRDIPVMALTSLSTVKSRQEVIDAGVSDFMGKPFHSETLLAKVRALIGID